MSAMASVSNNVPVDADATRPLVSVVIPFYKHTAYINETLRTCFGNTYPRMEVLIIDDGSPDPLTFADLTLDTSRYPLTIHRLGENRGVAHARNTGITLARGELVALLDADDLWRPDIIEKQVNIFQDDPATDWVYTNSYYLIDGKVMHKPNSAYHGFCNDRMPTGKDVNAQHLAGHNYMTLSSNMFRKSALLAAGLFNERLKVSEDWDLFVRVAERFNVRAIDEPLMFYRIHRHGRASGSQQFYVSTNVAILRHMYERQGLLPGRIDDFRRAKARIYERAGIQRLNNGLNPQARHYLFHRNTAFLDQRLRLNCLRLFACLPGWCYKAALFLFNFDWNQLSAPIFSPRQAPGPLPPAARGPQSPSEAGRVAR